MPKLIATAKTKGPALAISKGIDRDRAVDESGNQISVFGRRGARPLNRAESQGLYLRQGQLYVVSDDSEEAQVPMNADFSGRISVTKVTNSWSAPGIP